jgi:ketosteroid isomerase-like protein
MADNPNIATVARFVAAALAGDGETLKLLCAPGFVLRQGSGLAYGGEYPGGEGFMAFLGTFGETLDVQRLEPIRTYVTDDPDFLVGELEVAATVRATGARFESSLLERWRFEDGRVAEIKPHYFNAM